MKTAPFVLAAAIAAAGCSSHTPRPVAEVEVGGPSLAVAWAPRTDVLAAGAADRVVLMDDRGKVLRSLRVGANDVWGLAWSPDRKLLAAALGDGTVRLWRRSGRPAGMLAARHGVAFSVSWSPDADELAAGYSDGTVVKWSVADRRPVGVWPSHKAEVIAVAWSPGGDRIASGSIDETIRVREARTGRLRRVLFDPAIRERESTSTDDVNGLAWAPDGGVLAAANQDGIVRFWDPGARAMRARLRAGDGWSRGLSWTPNGKVLASSGQDGSIRLWDRKRRRQNRVLYVDTTPVWGVAWSGDGHHLAAVTDAGHVRIWAFG